MKKFQLHICLCLFLQVFSLPLLAQHSFPQLTRIDERAANINLDGFIDEAVWENIPVVDGMKVVNPDTLADARYETHIRMFYTERGHLPFRNELPATGQLGCSHDLSGYST